jgi:hypothetical protein
MRLMHFLPFPLFSLLHDWLIPVWLTQELRLLLTQLPQF